MSGYVRPRLTDQQAGMVRLLLEQRLAAVPGRTAEAGMLRRADAAIDVAFERREQRREERAQAREASSRRGVRGWLRRRRAG